jgi:hypothetical protein
MEKYFDIIEDRDNCGLKCTVNLELHRNNQKIISEIIDQLVSSECLYFFSEITINDIMNLSEFVNQYGTNEDRLKVIKFIEDDIQYLTDRIKEISRWNKTKSARNV